MIQHLHNLLKMKKILEKSEAELENLYFSFNNYITQLQSNVYHDIEIQNNLESRREMLSKLLKNGDEIITRKIDLIINQLSYKTRLQLSAINERITFLGTEKFKQATKNKDWKEWYTLETRSA